jgi:hypothetical protein
MAVARYLALSGHGRASEDLEQVGYLGPCEARKNLRSCSGGGVSSFATPTILGHPRDQGRAIRSPVPRGVQMHTSGPEGCLRPRRPCGAHRRMAKSHASWERPLRPCAKRSRLKPVAESATWTSHSLQRDASIEPLGVHDTGSDKSSPVFRWRAYFMGCHRTRKYCADSLHRKHDAAPDR